MVLKHIIDIANLAMLLAADAHNELTEESKRSLGLETSLEPYCEDMEGERFQKYELKTGTVQVRVEHPVEESYDEFLIGYRVNVHYGGKEVLDYRERIVHYDLLSDEDEERSPITGSIRIKNYLAGKWEETLKELSREIDRASTTKRSNKNRLNQSGKYQ